MAPHSSLLRRIALPMSLSLSVHVLLAGAIYLVEDRPAPEHGTPGENRPGLSITLVDRIEQPRPAVPSHTPSHTKPKKHDEGPFVHLSGPIDEVVEPSVESFASGLLFKGSGRDPVDRADPADPAAGAGRPASRGMGRGLLPVPATVRRVVYLVDRSVSMGPSGALATARNEIAASLQSLPPNTLFQIIPYNKAAEPLLLDGKRELAEANPATVDSAVEQLEAVMPSGATDSAKALRAALQLHPEVIYLLTDADDLAPARLTSLPQFVQCRVYVVELSRARPDQADGALARLARGTGGGYRRVEPDH